MVLSIHMGLSLDLTIDNHSFTKATVESIAPLLTRLFNKMFDQFLFPDDWSTAIICPIHKKGSKNNVENYRGTSLLPSFSKIFTSTLHRKLQKWSDENNLIIEEQSGFRRSTLDNIYILSTLDNKYFKKPRGPLCCAYIDLEKAIVRIDRNALWCKLIKLGLSIKMLKMLQSIYKNIKACVQTSVGITKNFVSLAYHCFYSLCLLMTSKQK